MVFKVFICFVFFGLFVCLLLVTGLLEFSWKGVFSIISFFSKKIYLRSAKKFPTLTFFLRLEYDDLGMSDI